MEAEERNMKMKAKTEKTEKIRSRSQREKDEDKNLQGDRVSADCRLPWLAQNLHEEDHFSPSISHLPDLF